MAASEAQEIVKHRKQFPFGQSLIGAGNQRPKAKSGPPDLTEGSFSQWVWSDFMLHEMFVISDCEVLGKHGTNHDKGACP